MLHECILQINKFSGGNNPWFEADTMAATAPGTGRQGGQQTKSIESAHHIFFSHKSARVPLSHKFCKVHCSCTSNVPSDVTYYSASVCATDTAVC